MINEQNSLPGFRRPIGFQTQKKPQHNRGGTRPGPGGRPRPNDFNGFTDNFGNTLGPDFGPVTFEEFGSNLQETFNSEFENNFQNPNILPKSPAQRPTRPQIRRPTRPSSGFKNKIQPFPPQSNHGVGFSSSNTNNAIQSINSVGFSHDNIEGNCQKYTEDICLDVTNYPQ